MMIGLVQTLIVMNEGTAKWMVESYTKLIMPGRTTKDK